MNYLGRYLKKKLKELKVSEREISAKCGISHSYLNQLIKGVNPSTKKNISPTLATFEKLSGGLEVSVEFLQRVARGKINEEDYFNAESNIAVDNLIESENKNISSDLLKQINDFHNFITIVGLNDKKRSEGEWSELICELKSIIGKHLLERK